MKKIRELLRRRRRRRDIEIVRRGGEEHGLPKTGACTMLQHYQWQHIQKRLAT